MTRFHLSLLVLTLLAGCQAYPSPPGLEPLEEPAALAPAPPRVNSAIPIDRSHERPVEARGVTAGPTVPTTSRSVAQGQAGDVTLNFVDTDIREIARTILGTTLKLNFTIDPNVHGTG